MTPCPCTWARGPPLLWKFLALLLIALVLLVSVVLVVVLPTRSLETFATLTQFCAVTVLLVSSLSVMVWSLCLVILSFMVIFPKFKTPSIFLKMSSTWLLRLSALLNFLLKILPSLCKKKEKM